MYLIIDYDTFDEDIFETAEEVDEYTSSFSVNKLNRLSIYMIHDGKFKKIGLMRQARILTD